LLDFFFLPVLAVLVLFFFPDFGLAATGGAAGGALGKLEAAFGDNSGIGAAAAIGVAGGRL
jgi:hypothetical protein